MKVNVQAPNFTVKESLIQFLEKRLQKLEQFYDKIVYADVFLKVQKTSEKQNKITEIILSVPGSDLICKKESKTFEAAIDECIQSLERQLKKRKQKQRAYA
ncbi:MAG TPA: ribosome-associated translation inhibitor RaiA [Flavobacteriaceae bacterium]|jgi:putative sigma-54 modulation protein|nr:ribosomal subunit interface protein [Flavobacteriaceae bacterium]MAY52530.1 ribosomal subunit interface protein [Flavobacteriaceae bacterium]HBR52847.1 ribosome-associated translation inhibitor RaiA [Flavobacteriaceae bacterium]HIB48727.1 ribosome-associated translation inhibitor RaiA [Flavobacteriaceae bacterium]HIN99847.1 ribosome-associated translation inhibitor RaiA [Flavobacteriaceae bacterium]|tara:strand:- start:84 stop:386 length:303 start_codon:yes stop_codon:yes gene_type:complete